MPFFRLHLARLALVGIAGAGCSFDWALPASPGAGGGVPGACAAEKALACASQGEVCNPESDDCVECRAEGDCRIRVNAESDFLYGCSASMQCVECAGDEDCRDNPYGFGGRCRDGICECAVSAECEGSAAGSRCVDFSCGCESAADCAANVRGKACVAVDIPLEECGCATDADCEGARNGASCEGGVCGCGADSDCEEAGYGPRCNARLGRPGCGCANDSECGVGETCKGAICPDPEAPDCVLGQCVAS